MSIQTFPRQKLSPRQHGHPEFVDFPFILKLDDLPELDESDQAFVDDVRERPTYKFREDLHKPPEMVLIHVTME